PEIIQDGVNGFITEPNNPEMLADKILEITNISADEMFKIRKRAQNDVKNISSVDKTMEKYVKIIENNYFVK
uniref:glycosyltransferase n=1 Tax=uncultured Methanobrevibacter sp. TaxID=253161 RepID=UPI0037440593